MSEPYIPMPALLPDDAHQVATEFCVFAASQGWSPARTILALRPPSCGGVSPPPLKRGQKNDDYH